MSVSDNKKNRGTHGDSSFMLGGLPPSSENPSALAVGSVNIKYDCLNYDKEKRWCKGLHDLICANRETKKCPFYKNQKMLDEQVAKVRKRIPDYDPNKRVY